MLSFWGVPWPLWDGVGGDEVKLMVFRDSLVKISFKAVKDFLSNDVRNVDFPSSELMI